MYQDTSCSDIIVQKKMLSDFQHYVDLLQKHPFINPTNTLVLLEISKALQPTGTVRSGEWRKMSVLVWICQIIWLVGFFVWHADSDGRVRSAHNCSVLWPSCVVTSYWVMCLVKSWNTGPLLQTRFLFVKSTITFCCLKIAVYLQCASPHLLSGPTLPWTYRWVQVHLLHTQCGRWVWKWQQCLMKTLVLHYAPLLAV